MGRREKRFSCSALCRLLMMFHTLIKTSHIKGVSCSSFHTAIAKVLLCASWMLCCSASGPEETFFFWLNRRMANEICRAWIEFDYTALAYFSKVWNSRQVNSAIIVYHANHVAWLYSPKWNAADVSSRSSWSMLQDTEVFTKWKYTSVNCQCTREVKYNVKETAIVTKKNNWR